MEIDKFLGINLVIVGVLGAVVFLYLVFLINKRRRDKFLHNQTEEED